MAGVDQVLVKVRAHDGEGDDALLGETARLRSELLELDVTSVDPVTAEDAPAGAKGLADIAGWLVVQVGTGEALRTVVDMVRGWATRSQRSIEIAYGDDVLKISGASAEAQERLIDAWITRHAAGA